MILGTPRQIHALCKALGGHHFNLATSDECSSCTLHGKIIKVLEQEDRASRAPGPAQSKESK